MFFRLVLLFTLLPLAELYLLLQVGSYLGVGMTILVVVGTGVMGAQLARLEGWRTWRQMQENIQQGIAPTGELIDGALILAAGLLLITPGIITDVVGFSLLFPPTRSAIKRYIQRKLDAFTDSSADSSTIEVEFTRRPK
jgi:UPF0716 protein FxsA